MRPVLCAPVRKWSSTLNGTTTALIYTSRNEYLPGCSQMLVYEQKPQVSILKVVISIPDVTSRSICFPWGSSIMAHMMLISQSLIPMSNHTETSTHKMKLKRKGITYRYRMRNIKNHKAANKEVRKYRRRANIYIWSPDARHFER